MKLTLEKSDRCDCCCCFGIHDIHSFSIETNYGKKYEKVSTINHLHIIRNQMNADAEG